jgi:hypothetical protein
MHSNFRILLDCITSVTLTALLHELIKQVYSSGNASDLYSGGAQFESRLGNRSFRLWFLSVLLNVSMQIPG